MNEPDGRQAINPAPARIRRMVTADLQPAEVDEIRALMLEAFGTEDDERFRDEDWLHALGGTHIVLEVDGRIVSHAAVVERPIEVGGRPLRTGYVEAMATAPDAQGRGLGSQVMTDVNAFIRGGYDLGMLGTGRQSFYERLGWRIWAGPSFVRTADGLQPSPDEDGYLLVLETPTTPTLDPAASISCDWRPGDSW